MLDVLGKWQDLILVFDVATMYFTVPQKDHDPAIGRAKLGW